MQAWWEAWPGRLEAELQRFAKLSLSFEIDSDEQAAGRIVLRGLAPVEGQAQTEFIVVYPDTFPHTRFEVFAPDLGLIRHQHPFSKNLCVMPRGSEHWQPDFLAADVIVERVPELVRGVRAGGATLREIESPQGEPVTDYFPYITTGGVVVPGEMLGVDPVELYGQLSLRFRSSTRLLTHLLIGLEEESRVIGQALLAEVRGTDGRILSAAGEALERSFQGEVWQGRWVRMPEPPETLDPNEIVRAATEVDPMLRPMQRRNRGSTSGTKKRGYFNIIGLLFPEEIRQGEYGDAWMFVASGAKDNKRATPIRRCFVRGMRYSPLDLGARIPELSSLPRRTVSLVGLGSIGMPVAQELAKAQLGHLRVLDPGFADPAASVRWEAGLDAAGAAKVAFAAESIACNYPYTVVEPFPARVGSVSPRGFASSEASMIEGWLGDTDLVIDATAEQNVRRVCAYQAHPLGTHQIYVYSIDGYGGVVARLIPGETGCLLCLERALSDGRIAPPPPADNAADRRVQPGAAATRRSPRPPLTYCRCRCRPFV